MSKQKPPSKRKRAPAKMGGLTARQRSFALAFAMLGNATQAALDAGYSPNGVSTHASRMLAKPAVQALVKVHREKAAAKQEAAIIYDAAWVAKEQAKVAKAAYEAKQYIAASKALRGVGDAVGIYVEKQEISGPGGKPIERITLDVGAMTDDELQRAIAAQEKPMLTLGGGNGKKNGATKP